MKDNITGLNEVYVEDINYSDGSISILSNNQLDGFRLVSKSTIVDYKCENNKINLVDFIREYKFFLPDSCLYEITHINNMDMPENIIVNCEHVSDRLYICKDTRISIDSDIYTLDVYINNKNRIKAKIDKELCEDDVKIIAKESLNLNGSILSIGMRFFTLVEDHEVIKECEYNPENVSFILYKKNMREFRTYNLESHNGQTELIIDLAEINPMDSDWLKSIIVIDGKRYDFKISSNVEFKKVKIEDDEVTRFVTVKADENKDLTIEFIKDYICKPVIQKYSYDKGIQLEGKLNGNFNSVLCKDLAIKLNLISRDKKNIFEKEIEISGDKFKVFFSESEIVELKKQYPAEWDMIFNITSSSIEYDIYPKYGSNESTSIMKQRIITCNDNILFEFYLTKDNKRPAFKIKSNITVTKILHCMADKKKLEVKYRTKENIEDLLDKGLLSTSISNSKYTMSSSKIKKIGKKTFLAYYEETEEVITEFINEAEKRGVNVILTANGIDSLSIISELDSDTIFYNHIEKLQRTKKYKALCSKLYNKLFLKLPIDKKTILFESFLGRNISGNPKYLYKQLVSEGLDKKYNLVWILNDLNEEIEGKHKKVKRKTLKYYYYMATAKYWIFNTRQSDGIVKRKENTYLQTWHGTPLKKLGMDMTNVSMAGQTDINDYKQKFYSNSRRWDYLLAQNDYSSEIFRSAFAFNKEILKGYPANDILYNENNKDSIDAIKDKLGIPKDKKVILYAPTWRDDNFYKKGHYRMSIQLDLDEMQKQFGDEYVILLRMHYLITNNLDIDKYKGFVYDYSQGYDIQELYLASDVLITDYSSVMFDYANLERPIIFFAYDIEQYRDSLRGFYFDFEDEAPGPIVTNTEGVIEALENIDKGNNEYKKKQINFYKKFCHIDDGNRAKEILRKINII